MMELEACLYHDPISAVAMFTILEQDIDLGLRDLSEILSLQARQAG